MGGLFSSSQVVVDSVEVEITPTFFKKKDYAHTVTDVDFKSDAKFRLSKNDVRFLFGENATVKHHSVEDGKLVYIVQLPLLTRLTRVRAYVKDAWWKYTHAGDPVRATFVKTVDAVFFCVHKKNVVVKKS